MTTTPFFVADLILILSTPTPALPITCNFFAFLISSPEICVPLRIIQPSTLSITSSSLSLLFILSIISQLLSLKILIPLSDIGSVIKILYFIYLISNNKSSIIFKYSVKSSICILPI